jgi:dihydroxyacetone kinase
LNRASLDEVTAVAKRAASQMATAAASLDKCGVPGRANQEALPHNQLEFGTGIHNEPGVMRENISSLESTVKKIVNMMFTPTPNMWHPKPGLRVALMVNNLGGLSLLELGVVADEVVRQVGDRGIKIERSLAGTFVTSLDGPGFSVTVLQLDDGLVELLDAPTTAPAWPRTIHGLATAAESVAKGDTKPMNGFDPQERVAGVKGKAARWVWAFKATTYQMIVAGSFVKALVHSVAKITAEDEPQITHYDTLAGDGDCGETLLNGIKGEQPRHPS